MPTSLRNAARAVDFMPKILPPIQIRAASDSCLRAERMEGRGAAGAEINYVGLENNEAERQDAITCLILKK